MKTTEKLFLAAKAATKSSPGKRFSRLTEMILNASI